MRSRRYGSTQMAARTTNVRQRSRPGERRQARAGDDEDRRGHDRDGDRRPQVGLDEDERERRADDEPDRAQELADGLRRRPPGEVGGDPDGEGDLGELGRLQRDRPVGQPPAGAVDRRPQGEHRDEEDEAAPGGAARPRSAGGGSPCARGATSATMPDDGVERLPLEVVGGVVGGEGCARRARAVDHDEPERDEPERHEHEQVVLEPPARPVSQGLHELPEPVAALLEVRRTGRSWRRRARGGRRRRAPRRCVRRRPPGRGRGSGGSGRPRGPGPPRSRRPSRR